LKPVKRRGNRRYYQHHEVLLIRRIRELLYEQGFTISGARQRLGDAVHAPAMDEIEQIVAAPAPIDFTMMRQEILAIIQILKV
jgi:DNA-binding transcriptional MerR regulator